MVSGDDAYIKHAYEVLGNIEGVITKWSATATSARTLLPQAARESIAHGVDTALDKLNQREPFNLKPPIELQVNCLRRKSAELLEYLPFVKRLDAYTIQFVAEDMIETSRFLSFLLRTGALTIN